MIFAYFVPVVVVIQVIATCGGQSVSDIKTQQTCVSVGAPGVAGSPGVNGLPGRDGTRGEKGRKGVKGIKGERGLDGNVGDKGNAGKIGPRGIKGEKGEALTFNWKQCVWNRDDGKDSGLIQNCNFTKHDNNSALHVAYAGTLRVKCPSGTCCSRWYFTFNGDECSGPMTIGGVVYGQPANDNPHRHRQIEGYCENIPVGKITIGFNIGNCEGFGTRKYDGHSGWSSVSRIMIEEVPSAQSD